jgi:hypothetical protein
MARPGSAANGRNGIQHDSFSDLASLMKAKKPYTPITSPASRPTLSVSPAAKPVEEVETVKSFLQNQEMATTPTVPGYRQKDLDRLEALTGWIRDYQTDDETDRQSQSPPPPSPVERSLLPGFQSPPRIRPVAPPTPAESDHGPQVVRVPKTIWDSMNNELRPTTAQIPELEQQPSSLDRKYQALLEDHHDAGTQLGKLRYQNEANREQKAAMGRSLAQKEIESKKQQLEIDNLNKTLAEWKTKVGCQQKELDEADWLRRTYKDTTRDLEDKVYMIRRLEEMVERVTLERDDAVRAQINNGDHAVRAQNLADTLTKREKLITDLRQKTLEEQMRATDLEDEVERLKEQVVSSVKVRA